MRTLWLTYGSLMAVWSWGLAQGTSSAMEMQPEGWIDLAPGLDLQGWTVLPLPAEGQVSRPLQWRRDPAAGTVVCEGTGGHDWLRYDREWRDFIFHVEWRFTPIEGGKGYNSGIFVRNSADGKIWHQGQAGGGSGGYLFGNTLVGGQVKRVNLRESSIPGRVKPAGEWNTYELTCKGPHITLWTNGAVTSEFCDCEVLSGYLGLEAEGYRIEFRNIKVKELK